jgi:hypothetical protein
VKKRIRKALAYLALAFVALFCIRLGYGYLRPTREPGELDAANAISEALVTTVGGRATQNQYYPPAGAYFDSLKSNYATARVKIEPKGESKAYSVDQKYEKVASMTSESKSFEEDEKQVREATIRYSALIQFEQATGLPGSRSVNLAIGVPPDRFDPMVEELKSIGELSSIRIDKTDKTNEYKELMAKRASLEKARDSLIALKSKGGRIEEYSDLENRILEIEGEIQASGVKLGDYDAENEFCTVKLTLEEKRAVVVAGISFGHRVNVALAWTIKYYTIGLGFLFFGTLCSLLIVVLLQRLNVIPPPTVAPAS